MSGNTSSSTEAVANHHLLKCTANGAVIDDAPLKNARALADFAVTTKENQWKFALKSTPSLELLIVLLNFHHEFC
jgi:hypothetical protein